MLGARGRATSGTAGAQAATLPQWMAGSAMRPRTAKNRRPSYSPIWGIAPKDCGHLSPIEQPGQVSEALGQ